jgi:putative membrane-bound dehydrogenase-like protein
MRTALSALLLCFAVGLVSIAPAQQPAKAPVSPEPDYSAQLKRIPPLKADEALDSFQVVHGFQLQLVAAEPLVASPVAMAFDEDGRLFVIEMRDYSEHPNENLGRVRLLEDDDGDGVMDRSTVFADKLSWPTAIACANGGVFVGAAPNILFLKDTDGDGRADEKTVVFTGFNRNNVQGLLNTFLYGLDHRLHCSASSTGGSVRRADDPTAKPLELRGRDFAFDPITLAIDPISGGAQHGATFDDYGRRFLCSNSDHLQMVMYEDRYAASSKVAAPPSKMSIAADGPQAEVFRISPVESWRELRTKLRVAGTVPGPVEGGGRAAGYFTSATGLTIYRGDAWPPENRGIAFVADVGSNIIHRKRLTPRGIGFVGERIDQGREFLASKDIWFRPVQMVNAPDGCLWVIDMYRETIEHPASLPPAIKKHLDLDSGRDRGRIYRIAPIPPKSEGVEDSDFKPRLTPKLSKATSPQLVALLEHSNAWHRETASRLLHERQDAGAVAPIRKMLKESKSPLGQLHAMYALEGMRQLTEADILGSSENAFTDEVQEHAVRFLESLARDHRELTRPLSEFTGSKSPRVRFQAALSIGALPAGADKGALGAVLVRSDNDRYVRWAVLNSAGGDRLALLSAVLSSRSGRAGIDTLDSIIAELGGKDLPGALKLVDGDDSLYATAVVFSVAERVRRGGGDPGAMIVEHLPHYAEIIPVLLEQGRRMVTGAEVSEASAISGIQLIRLGKPSEVMDRLSKLLAPSNPPTVQMAAADSLAGYPQVQAISFLLEGAAQASPSIQSVLIDALLSRTERITALVDAIENAKLPITALNAQQRARLLNVSDETLRARAAKLIAPSSDRAALVGRYTKSLADVTGDAARGKTLFAVNCAACHKLEGVGHELGPNLAAFAQKGADAVLTNVLDPNREVNPQFLNYVVALKDGEVVSGIIKGETASSVTVAGGKGVERTLSRGDIESLRATGKSIMPEGLEATLDVQAVSDVIAYLSSLTEAKK